MIGAPAPKKKTGDEKKEDEPAAEDGEA